MANGTGNGGEKPESNKNIIQWVIVTLCVNATIGVCTFAYCLVFDKKPDVALFTTFVGIVNYILGVISGLLAKTSPTQATPAPAEAKIVNPPTEPVPVADPAKVTSTPTT